MSMVVTLTSNASFPARHHPSSRLRSSRDRGVRFWRNQGGASFVAVGGMFPLPSTVGYQPIRDGTSTSTATC